MAIDRGIDKEDVVHRYNEILLSCTKNEIGSFVEMWMDLKSIIQHEVRIGILLDRFRGAIRDDREGKSWR